ncbi:serpin family protein, partial [Salmonella sp. SAL04281]|uniref:serpin family protein n=1 Tax=Salmonella sp. SAL04281 TaxID=3159859 RepID=UPI00397DBAC4
YELITANALWGQKGFPFLPAFLKTMKDDYGGGLREVDFRASAEQARRTINDWVEKQSREKIRDLFPEGILNDRTRLV